MTSPEEVRSLARAGDGPGALELALAAAPEWFAAGLTDEARGAIAEALEAPGADLPTPTRARVLYQDGRFAFRQGDAEGSRLRNEEALGIARTVDDPRAESEALVGLSRVAFRAGDYGLVCDLARQAREVARAVGDRDALATPLHMLAAGTRLGGDYAQAHALYEESLELSRARANEHWIEMELHNLAWVELHLGDGEAARRRFAAWREAAATRTGADVYGSGMQTLNDAAVAWIDGDRERARELARDAEATLASAGIVLDPDDAFEVAWLREQLAE